MNMPSKVKVLVLALGLFTAVGPAQAQFTRGMDQANLNAEVEVKLQLLSGLSLSLIVKQAKDSGIRPEPLAKALMQAGVGPVAVARSVAVEFPSEAGLITDTVLKLAPDEMRNQIITAVLTVPGVNPTTVLEATAAGSESEQFGHHHEAVHFHVPAETPHSGGGNHHSASPS